MLILGFLMLGLFWMAVRVPFGPDLGINDLLSYRARSFILLRFISTISVDRDAIVY